jgi:hypothetical protein
MSYRFMDGSVVGASVEPTRMVPVTVLPQNTIICDGCGCAMCTEGHYVKGTDGINFYCGTSRCEHAGKLIYIPYGRVSIAVAGIREY